MEALTRLVADSLARHGLDRPIDPRRLQWSRWFRCDSPHSLLVIPSKPGIFALAEEIMDMGTATARVGTAALGCPAEQRSAAPAAAPSGLAPKRMLAVLQFCEDDDMAYVLDRMFTRINPMRSRLASGRCFVRFVVIQDQDQRRSISSALNQWLVSSAEKATGLPSDFSSSLELTESVGRTLLSASAEAVTRSKPAPSAASANFAKAFPEAVGSHLDSRAARNLHCPHPLPSGF